jgi:hypothetical protein
MSDELDRIRRRQGKESPVYSMMCEISTQISTYR